MGEIKQRGPAPTAAGFDAVWMLSERIPGWLTRDQAAVLWTAARGISAGAMIVEIGSHQGRSTVVLGAGAAGAGATVVAIDPFLEGALFGGQRSRVHFEQHVANAGLDKVVSLMPDYSANVLARWGDRVDMLYIDGKHDYWSCTKDLGWVTTMPTGAPVFIHDAFSSVGVTTSVLREYLRRRPRLSYQGRTGSLAGFVVAKPTARERLAVIGELPWFCRNLVIKVLLRLRLPRFAGALGHDSPYDPY